MTIRPLWGLVSGEEMFVQLLADYDKSKEPSIRRQNAEIKRAEQRSCRCGRGARLLVSQKLDALQRSPQLVHSTCPGL